VSSNLAFATPLRSPREEQPHIEIVSTREQRRARPRVVYALVTVAGLFALFIAQLLLSIVVADGAYRISALQSEQSDLGRQEKSLSEELDLLASPQNLATQAESLGMLRSSSSPAFLRLSDGAIVGQAAAAADGTTVVGAAGNLVANDLLGGIPLVTPPAGAAVDPAVDPAADPSVAAAAGAPTAPGTIETVPSTPGALPSPVTR
jgi:hypothetical protein